LGDGKGNWTSRGQTNSQTVKLRTSYAYNLPYNDDIMPIMPIHYRQLEYIMDIVQYVFAM